VVPHVESAADAERVVARMRYPPRGSRGTAARRASLYGLEEAGGADPICMVQIESKRALQYADAIAAVDGVDVLVAGCADLAVALGEDPITSSGRVRDAVRHVQGVAYGAGIASGVAGPDDPELLAQLAGGRSSFVVLGADVRLFARAVDTALGRMGALLARTAPDWKESHVRT
jgi:4-hydroxy-2-oxoheptanedioate aldolase